MEGLFVAAVSSINVMEGLEASCEGRVPDFVPLHPNITSLMETEPAPVYPPWEIALKVFTYVVIIIISLVGNSLVIYVVARFTRMRTVTNVYMVNLSVAGLLVTFVSTWVHLGDNISPEWPFGRVNWIPFTSGILLHISSRHKPFIINLLLSVATLCCITQGWSLLVGILIMTVVAAKRFFIIVYPLRARLTSGYSVFTLVATWLVAAAFALPNALFWEQYDILWANRHEVWCEESWPRYYYINEEGECKSHAPGQEDYVTVIVVALFFVPLFLMTTAYVLIVNSLWRRQSVMQQVARPLKNSILEMHRRTRKKVVRMLITVLAVYVVCWAPFVVVNLWLTHWDVEMTDSIRQGKYAVTFLAYSNSALNPILYAALNSGFRKAFRDVFVRQNSNTQVAPDPQTASSGGHSATPQVSNPGALQQQFSGTPHAAADGQSTVEFLTGNGVLPHVENAWGPPTYSENGHI